MNSFLKLCYNFKLSSIADHLLNNLFLILALPLLLTGCVGTLITVTPVGPQPSSFSNSSPTGKLIVFSYMESQMEGDNPPWLQHTPYYIYDEQRKRIKHVSNTTGYYATEPATVSLPIGNYVIRAHARDLSFVEVPVKIEGGQTTVLHLCDDWTPPSLIEKTNLVFIPNAKNPIGWSTHLKK